MGRAAIGSVDVVRRPCQGTHAPRFGTSSAGADDNCAMHLASGAKPTYTAVASRSLRLSVRTSDFQSEKTGSTPVGIASDLNEFHKFRQLFHIVNQAHHFTIRPRMRSHPPSMSRFRFRAAFARWVSLRFTYNLSAFGLVH